MERRRRMLGTAATAAGLLLILLAIGSVILSWPGIGDRLSGNAPPHDADEKAAPTTPSIRPFPQQEAPSERWSPTLVAASVALPLIFVGVALILAGRRLSRA